MFIIIFMSFCKIIGFTKQIYENKSLSPNHVFTFKISRFTIFIFLLILLWFFIKIISFLSQIGPLWAHKGPYGPIRALWAHKCLDSTKLRQSFDKTSTKFCRNFVGQRSERQNFDKVSTKLCRFIVSKCFFKVSIS